MLVIRIPPAEFAAPARFRTLPVPITTAEVAPAALKRRLVTGADPSKVPA